MIIFFKILIGICIGVLGIVLIIALIEIIKDLTDYRSFEIEEEIRREQERRSRDLERRNDTPSQTNGTRLYRGSRRDHRYSVPTTPRPPISVPPSLQEEAEDLLSQNTQNNNMSKNIDPNLKKGRLKTFPKRPYLGADPELFFTKNGEVIGSCEILDSISNKEIKRRGRGKVVKDGIPFEIHPNKTNCRQTLAYNIAYIFEELENYLSDISNKTGDDYGITLDSTVTVPKDNFDKIPNPDKRFGCEPSYNIYRRNGMSKEIDVIEEKYRPRFSGGHIHLGGRGNRTWMKNNVKRIVQMLDIVVGIPSVLLDREEGNVERRKKYGRAGEYRKKPYGLEYRTLSNFWLKHYVLMHMVFGLSRMAVWIVRSSDRIKDLPDDLFSEIEDNKTPEEKILDRINKYDVKKAINNNDFDLAKEIFDEFKEVLPKIIPQEYQKESDFSRDMITKNYSSTDYVLNPENIEYFEHFVEKGIDYWFDEDDIMDYWIQRITNGRSLGNGFESFLDRTVKRDK